MRLNDYKNVAKGQVQQEISPYMFAQKSKTFSKLGIGLAVCTSVQKIFERREKA